MFINLLKQVINKIINVNKKIIDNYRTQTDTGGLVENTKASRKQF